MQEMGYALLRASFWVSLEFLDDTLAASCGLGGHRSLSIHGSSNQRLQPDH